MVEIGVAKMVGVEVSPSHIEAEINVDAFVGVINVGKSVPQFPATKGKANDGQKSNPEK